MKYALLQSKDAKCQAHNEDMGICREPALDFSEMIGGYICLYHQQELEHTGWNGIDPALANLQRSFDKEWGVNQYNWTDAIAAPRYISWLTMASAN